MLQRKTVSGDQVTSEASLHCATTEGFLGEEMLRKKGMDNSCTSFPYPHNQLFEQSASRRGKPALSIPLPLVKPSLSRQKSENQMLFFSYCRHLDIRNHPSLVLRKNVFPINIAFPLLLLKGSRGLSPAVGTSTGEDLESTVFS